MATSVTGRLIRLTETAWKKIQRDHLEFTSDKYVETVRRVVEQPDYIVAGRIGGLIAIGWCEDAPVRPKHIAVVYRELNGDGFVITAFLISRVEQLLKRGVIWEKKS